MCYFEVTSIFLRRQNFEGWYPVCENVLIFASDSTFNPRIFVCSQIRCWIVLCWKKNSIGFKQSQRGSARIGCGLLRFALAEYFFSGNQNATFYSERVHCHLTVFSKDILPNWSKLLIIFLQCSFPFQFLLLRHFLSFRIYDFTLLRS